MGIRADTFFEVILPAFLEERRSRRAGNIGIVVADMGAWLIELRCDRQSHIRRARPEDVPMARLDIAPEFFDAFARGAFDARAALSAGHLTIEGAHELVLALTELLAPPVAAAAQHVPASGFALRRPAEALRHEPKPLRRMK